MTSGNCEKKLRWLPAGGRYHTAMRESFGLPDTVGDAPPMFSVPPKFTSWVGRKHACAGTGAASPGRARIGNAGFDRPGGRRTTADCTPEPGVDRRMRIDVGRAVTETSSTWSRPVPPGTSRPLTQSRWPVLTGWTKSRVRTLFEPV